MHKLFGWLTKLVPTDYKIKIAIKNVSLGASKLIMSLLVGKFGKDMAPEHVEAVGVAVTILTQLGLEGIHDWARLKFPNAKL